MSRYDSDELVSLPKEPLGKGFHSYKAPIRIAGIYLLLALTWIFTSDRALELVTRDYSQLAKLQTYKGSAFVAVMALVIFVLVRRQVVLLVEANERQARIASMLREAYGRQELALSAAHLGSWEFNLDSNTVHCDPRSARHFGVTPITAAADFFSALHPDDQLRARDGYEMMAEGQYCPPADYRFRQPDGTYRWVAINTLIKNGDFGTRSKIALGTSQDITERKRAEQSLKASEDLLRSATNNTGVGLVVLDTERRYTFANRAYSEILGISEDIIGKSPKDVLKGAYENQIKPQLDRAYSGQKVSYELKGPIDASRHYSVIYEPRVDNAGGVESITVIIFDVTNIKRSEEALRLSEQRLKHVLDATGEGIWDWSIQIDVVQHNAQWCRLLGLDDSYLKHPLQTFIDLIHPDDQAAVRAALRACLDNAQPYFSEHRIYRAEGDHIWVQDRGDVVERDAAGVAIRMVGSMVDITARKIAESELKNLLAELQHSEREAHRQKMLQKSIFDCTPDGVVLVDLSRNITDLNPAFTRIFGYTISDLQGKNSRCLYATEDDYNLVGASIAAGTDGLVAQPLHCIRNDGEVFPAQMTRAKLLGLNGDEVGYIGVFRDISREITRDNALREKQRLEALGRLTGGIAHDFNNLLTVISGNAQLISMDHPADRHKRYLAEIECASEMGARLNRRLVTFAQQRDLEPEALNLNTSVASLHDLMQRSISNKYCLSLELDANPASVRIDRSEMENAILNLIINARDAMPNGGEIKISTSNYEVDEQNASVTGELGPGHYIRLNVSDTGTGMSAEVISRAFEPFFTTKKERGGSGLGLTTIHGFVHQSSGHVSLRSSPGRGTIVSIFLPALPGVDPPREYGPQ